ncbi:oxygenase MpaB family protein [Nocardia inohanensis]|uniref:oxygenase MpaB family protein n=1 Tax=Nocardia inohanensis TaxID=209246 RepID=UPI00082B99CF|nr:oxygenase MpaB family protein [Nocardia inohanensis]
MTSTKSSAGQERRAWPVWEPTGPAAPELAAGIAAAVAGRTARLLAGSVMQRGLATFEPPLTAADAGIPGDPGWFGPDSVIWRVFADRSVLIGGSAAVTMQGLHPRAFHGFAEHTDFTSDPNGRLMRTLNTLQRIVYGDSEQARDGIRHTNHAHKPVQGSTPDGGTYDAREPELALWVHMTTFGAVAAAYQRFGPQPLSAADLDRFIGDTAVIGRKFGLKNAPATWNELREAMDSYRPLLSLDERAARGISYFREPFGLPAPARRLLIAIWPGTVVCMPPICQNMLMQPRPTTTQLASCRAIVRALDAAAGPPEFYTVAKARTARTH